MVVREYLTQNFGFDDSQVKTLGLGKQPGANLDADWGSIQILIFPPGSQIPADKAAPASSASTKDAGAPAQVKAASGQKQ